VAILGVRHKRRDDRERLELPVVVSLMDTSVKDVHCVMWELKDRRPMARRDRRTPPVSSGLEALSDVRPELLPEVTGRTTEESIRAPQRRLSDVVTLGSSHTFSITLLNTLPA
jgi:hypothetical protein